MNTEQYYKNLPQPYPATIDSALFKSCPEDFVVNEQLTIDFSNTGEHLWLKIRKKNINTAYLAEVLAKWAKVPLRDVGFSGLKDRLAVTTQWFSIRIPKQTEPSTDLTSFFNHENEFVEIIEQYWHSKKLNRSTHKNNEFIIRLREVTGDKQKIEEQLKAISHHGLANYFGEQRFGRDGANLQKFLELMKTSKKPSEENNEQSRTKAKRKGRRSSKHEKEKSILISSARSALFNAILRQRVLENTWNKALEDDIFNLNGSGSVFVSEVVDEEIVSRVENHDIHPTGALWGDSSQSMATHTLMYKEQLVLRNDQLLTELARELEELKMKPARRPLRLVVSSLKWHWENTHQDDNLVLKFCLPSGSYATAIIDSLMK